MQAGNPDDDRGSGFMKLALELARKAHGKTWPNPMVGAVVVKGSQVVGSGYHRRAGLAHAEVEALNQAGSAARGADLYVTLEPCHLTGKTGACTERIKAAGIDRVFVGTLDPNPNESGRGISVLRRMGVRIEENVQETACRRINEVYNVFISKHRPFVQVKMAMSLDGRTATRVGDSQWISSSLARRHVHKLRSAANAVMIGAATARKDNPRLDVRKLRGKNPAVAVLDTNLSLTPKKRLFSIDRGSPVWIYCGRRANRSRAKLLASAGAEVISVSARKGFLDLQQVLCDLYCRGVYQLLVEGGATLFGSLLKSRLVDRVELHQAPCLLGSRGAPLAVFDGPALVTDAPRLVQEIWKRRGPDMCLSARLEWPGQAEQEG